MSCCRTILHMVPRPPSRARVLRLHSILSAPRLTMAMMYPHRGNQGMYSVHTCVYNVYSMYQCAWQYQLCMYLEKSPDFKC